MILEANGVAYQLPLKDLDVRLNMKLENQDASGKTSSTDDLNNGTKPKRLMVNGVLAMAEAEQLTVLIRKAEAVSADGQRQVYTITNGVADASDVREVKFTDNFDVRQRQGVRAWQINFTLKEHKSVPETAESRATNNPVINAATTSGNSVSSPDDQGNDGIDAAEIQHGFVYSMLKNLDNLLAPDDEQ